MLIKVFDSPWFDPSGITIEKWDNYSNGVWITRGVYTWSGRYGGGEAEVKPDGIYIENKTADEVANEINKQLRLAHDLIKEGK